MRDIGEGIVDDFVYTGSPGAGVYSVETLGVDKEHVWVSGIPHLDGVLGKGSYWNFGRIPGTSKVLGICQEMRLAREGIRQVREIPMPITPCTLWHQMMTINKIMH